MNSGFSNRGIIFPSVHSDRMETIAYVMAFKFATLFGIVVLGSYFLFSMLSSSFEPERFSLAALGISSAVVLCSSILSLVLFFKRHKPSAYNLIISKIGFFDILIDIIKTILVIVFIIFFFLHFYILEFPVENLGIYAIFFILLVSYCFSGFLSYLITILAINSVRVFWFLTYERNR